MVELQRRGCPSKTTPSDAVEAVEVSDGRLQREHRERKAVVEALKTRMPPEALSKQARSVLPARSAPPTELPPQRHVPKPTLDRVSGRKVRLGKQTAVCGEVVQPRCSDHARGILRRTFPLREERGQLGLSPL